MPGTPLADKMNAAVMLVDANVESGRGEKVAIWNAGDGSAHSYAQVLEMTNRVGNALKDVGVRMEERVLLLLPDSPEMVYSFFGAIKIGAVPIPVNTLLKPAAYEFLLNDSRARVLITTDTLLAQIETIRNRLPYLRTIVVVGHAETPDLSFHEWTAAALPDLSPEMLSKDDVCFWLYSSGTTGFPKGAVHLQHDMIVSADLYARPILGLNEEDRTFSVAKLFFAYGLGNGLYFPFRCGATTILYPGKPEPAKVFEIIDRHRPTVFFSVPTAYANMLAIADAPSRFDTSSVRLCVSAGEALPPALYHRWKERFGVEILDGIGSTEILHIFISNRQGRVKAGSTGEIVPGYEARIVDELGNDVTHGQIGDLLIQGDSTCSLYWNRHEQTKRTIQGPWIRTGDKYLQDEDGYFWYQGRSDDMLKVSGMWVSPIEIENVLIEHAAVLESAVVGAPDRENLIKPKAFIVLSNDVEGSQELTRELQEFVKDKIGAYKYPRWIEFVPELPKTATGKTQRYKLRR